MPVFINKITQCLAFFWKGAIKRKHVMFITVGIKIRRQKTEEINYIDRMNSLWIALPI